jgi:hypothetical protein
MAQNLSLIRHPPAEMVQSRSTLLTSETQRQLLGANRLGQEPIANTIKGVGSYSHPPRMVYSPRNGLRCDTIIAL